MIQPGPAFPTGVQMALSFYGNHTWLAGKSFRHGFLMDVSMGTSLNEMVDFPANHVSGQIIIIH